MRSSNLLALLAAWACVSCAGPAAKKVRAYEAQGDLPRAVASCDAFGSDVPTRDCDRVGLAWLTGEVNRADAMLARREYQPAYDLYLAVYGEALARADTGQLGRGILDGVVIASVEAFVHGHGSAEPGHLKLLERERGAPELLGIRLHRGLMSTIDLLVWTSVLGELRPGGFEAAVRKFETLVSPLPKYSQRSLRYRINARLQCPPEGVSASECVRPGLSPADYHTKKVEELGTQHEGKAASPNPLYLAGMFHKLAAVRYYGDGLASRVSPPWFLLDLDREYGVRLEGKKCLLLEEWARAHSTGWSDMEVTVHISRCEATQVARTSSSRHQTRSTIVSYGSESASTRVWTGSEHVNWSYEVPVATYDTQTTTVTSERVRGWEIGADVEGVMSVTGKRGTPEKMPLAFQAFERVNRWGLGPLSARLIQDIERKLQLWRDRRDASLARAALDRGAIAVRAGDVNSADGEYALALLFGAQDQGAAGWFRSRYGLDPATVRAIMTSYRFPQDPTLMAPITIPPARAPRIQLPVVERPPAKPVVVSEERRREQQIAAALANSPEAREAKVNALKTFTKWENWGRDHPRGADVASRQAHDRAHKEARLELATTERAFIRLFGPDSAELAAFRARQSEVLKLLKASDDPHPRDPRDLPPK